MPVRSLTSSVLKWPERDMVVRCLNSWAAEMVRNRPEVVRIGYFGSYARNDWGVGSDLDLIVIVESSDQPFLRRSLAWDTTDLPVPVDVLVYTLAEWEDMDRKGRFGRMLDEEVIWVYER